MIPVNSELQKARRDLGKFLDELSSDTRDREMIELLVDMHRCGALAFRWDERHVFPIRLWYPLNPDDYADRIFPIEEDFAALLAERFLLGEIEFSPRTAPPLTVEWYERAVQPPKPAIM